MPARRDIFVSYSHRDKGWLERLQVHLKPLFRDSTISVWNDTRLEPGVVWPDKIEEALARSAAAVLLLSPDFFASDFIMNVEWPRLKQAAEERGLKILPIAVRPSAVYDTDLGAYQGLMDLSTPLDHFSPPEQDAQLVTIARRIRDLVNQAPVDRGGAVDSGRLVPLRTLEINRAGLSLCVFDGQSHLWVSSGGQVKVFRIDQEQPIQRWLLPHRIWKDRAAAVWDGHLMMADWAGTLWRLSSNDRDGAIYRARDDSLPFHLVSACANGQLIAGSWDGTIYRWNADGSVAGHPIAVPQLPTEVMPLPNGAIGVVDQANVIRVMDADGSERWSWNADEPIRAAWPISDDGELAFVAIVGRRRVVKLVVGETRARELVLQQPIVSFSRRRGVRDEWIVVACELGSIHWLSVSPFNLVPDSAVVVEFPVREIVAMSVEGSSQQYVQAALGLTAAGQLFVVEDRKVRLYEEPSGIEQLLVAPSNRFISLQIGDRLEIHRNPAVPPSRCRVEVTELAGTLVRGGFKKLLVKVTNSGDLSIHTLRAELHADGIIDRSKNVRTLSLPIAPGEPIQLEFAVRALVIGDAVPLSLKLELTDEGGPPPSVEELSFNVESLAS